MSELSSSQQPRPRTMASDISKLFRSVASAPRADKDTETPTSTETSSDRVGSTKKKITRIPLFGRTRKKSNHSSSSSPYASTSIIRASTDVGEISSSEPERRPSLPTLSTPVLSSSKVSTSSFTTKFAAHFSSSQSTKSNVPPLDPRTSSSRISLISVPSSSGLVPPRARPSYESGSSTGSRTRSTTPRGARPVIMVSTTDNMDEFKDLFTKELPPTKAMQKLSGNLPDADVRQESGPSSRSRTPEQTIYRRGQTPASVLAAAIRDQTHKRQPSASSKNSRQTTDSEKSSSNEKSDGRTTPRLSSPGESPRLVQVSEKEKVHSRRPSTSQGVDSSATLRPRMRPPSRTKPPSIPLPDIPTPITSSDSPSPTKLEGTDFSEAESRASEASRPVRRPRANTISSIPEVPSRPASGPLPQDRSGSATLDPLNAVNIEDIDIDTASAEQLRRALRSRNKQFEELTAYMLRREEAWSAERKTLEKKAAVLQRDVVRRESEITGLKLIINDEDVLRRPKPLPSILNQSRLSPISTSPVQSDQEGSTQSHASGSRRMNYQSDSGPESPKGSGNESSSSILRLKKMHQRSSAIVGEGYPTRPTSCMRLPKFAQNMQVQEKPTSESPYSKRVSTMSIVSSTSSGSSSLMPPSPSITMSSLSAIPEGAPQESNDLEERRIRASRRISASSLTSSSTAASSAYSVKRSRPPSIAQVLEKSPNIDDVLEKLRPFA